MFYSINKQPSITMQNKIVKKTNNGRLKQKNPYGKNHRDIQNYVNQLHSLSDSNCDSYGGADHRVVAHTHKAHHLDVCRN